MVALKGHGLHASKLVRTADGSVYEPAPQANDWPSAHQWPSGQVLHCDSRTRPRARLYVPEGHAEKAIRRLDAADTSQ